MEHRLEELETRIAFQEDAIQSLNEVCARLQQEVVELKLELDKTKKQLRAMTPSVVAAESEETPPPHY